MWSRQFGEKHGVSIPLYPAEHFYVLTEPIKDLPNILPTLRDFDDCLYLKEDAGKILIGIFETKSIPAFKKDNKVPENFSFGEFPENFDHFEPYLEAAMKRMPVLGEVGLRKFSQDLSHSHLIQIHCLVKFQNLRIYLSVQA